MGNNIQINDVKGKNNNEGIKISVIIPVYNTEKYLRECLESVIAQTLKEIEIICVNDGSSDNSLQILEQYAKMDERILVLSKENGGVSSARNCGMEKATGKYLMFLDSDDWYTETESLQVLYEYAEKEQLDELFFGTKVFFENEEVKKNNLFFEKYYTRKEIYNGVIEKGQDLFVDFQKNRNFKPNVCLQIFKREFLEKNNLRFQEKILHEDEVFSLQCITLADRASYLDLSYYGRRVRENSIMTNQKKDKSIYSHYRVIKELIGFVENCDIYDDEYYEQFYRRLLILLENAVKMYLKETRERGETDVLEKIGKTERYDFRMMMELACDSYTKKSEITQYKQTIKENQSEIKKYRQETKENQSEIEKKRQQIKKYQQKIKENESQIKKISSDFNKALEREKNLEKKLQLVTKEKEEIIQKNKIDVERLQKRIEEKDKKIKELELEQERIKASYSYRVGNGIMYLPRKAKKIVKKISN